MSGQEDKFICQEKQGILTIYVVLYLAVVKKHANLKITHFLL